MHSYEFEPLLAKLTGNLVLSVIEELLMRLEVELELSIPINALHSPSDQLGYNEESYIDHRRIADAVIEGEPERAREEMVRHRRRWADLLRRLVRESKEPSLEPVEDAP
jgi:DNA-binding FadR family transcriptional regulator